MATANGNPNYKLTGIHPLAYLGVEPTTPPQMIVADVAPTSGDATGFDLGTFWLVKSGSPQQLWILTRLFRGVATWVQLLPAAATGIQTITGNSGGAVGPDGADNINIIGSGGVTVTGNPGTNTLTVTSPGAGALVLLDSQTVNNVTEVVFDNTLITNTYSTYFFNIRNVTFATDPSDINLQISTNNGATWNPQAIHTGLVIFNSGGGGSTTYDESTTFIMEISDTGDVTNSSVQPLSAQIYCNSVNTGQPATFSNDCMYIQSGPGISPIRILTTGWVDGGSPIINAMRFAMVTGTTMSGTFNLYGLVE